MINKKNRLKISIQSLALLIISVLLIISCTLGLTLAYFTDIETLDDSVVLVLGNIIVDAKIVEDNDDSHNNFPLTAQEMNPGSDAYRTLKITIPQKSEDFYLRMSYEFKIDDTDSNMITMSIPNTVSDDYWDTNYSDIDIRDSSYWVYNSGNDNKYYYKYALSKINGEQTDYYFPLEFHISQDMGTDIIHNNNVSLKIYIDVIQVANGGESEWKTDTTFPTGWPFKA